MYAKCNTKTTFATYHGFIRRRDAGEGDLEVHLVNNANGSQLPCRVIDNEDGTFLAEVIPPLVGTYTTHIKYGGLAVPKTPVVQVAAAVDVSKIKVDGLEESEYHNYL